MQWTDNPVAYRARQKISLVKNIFEREMQA